MIIFNFTEWVSDSISHYLRIGDKILQLCGILLIFSEALS